MVWRLTYGLSKFERVVSRNEDRCIINYMQHFVGPNKREALIGNPVDGILHTITFYTYIWCSLFNNRIY
jgi:hypothetical protein